MNRAWAVGILLVAMLLAMGTVMANEIAKQARYVDEKEYKKQINELINEVRKIRDKVKNGELTPEKAKKEILSLIDNPKYNQIKLMKEIVESKRKYELEHEKPKRVPQNMYSKIEESAIVPLSSTYYYYGVDDMTAYKGGWGCRI